MKPSSKYSEEKKIHDLENVKLKLKMISKNSNSSKVSVDEYIHNILGSGLNISKPSNFVKTESQSAQNLRRDKCIKYNGNDFTNSSMNISQNMNLYTNNRVESEFFSNLPSIYQDVINKVKLPTGELDTQQIYNIFISSGLSTDILGYIWFVINRTTPGKLTTSELLVGLIMVALYQKQSLSKENFNFTPLTWDQVVSRGDFPIPLLSVDRSSNPLNGIDLSNVLLKNQYTSVHGAIPSDEIAEDNENWADFSSFISSSPNKVVKTVDLEKNKSEFTTVNSIREVPNNSIPLIIHNQIPLLQTNIKSEKNLTNVFNSESQEQVQRVIKESNATNETLNILDISPSITDNKTETTCQQKFHEISNLIKPLDIHKQINEEFSTWQNDIKSEFASTNLFKLKNGVSFIPITNISSKIQNDNSLQKVNGIPTDEKNSNKAVVDSDFGDFQIFNQSLNNSSNIFSSNSKTSNQDRYRIFNSDSKDPNHNLIDQWIRCLNQCKKIIVDTVNVLNQVSDQSIKVEIFNSDKGNLLLSGIIEVYRVTRNIKLSSSKTNILTSSNLLVEVFTNIEKYWNDFMLILPDEMQIDVQTRLSRGAQNCDLNHSLDDVSLTDFCGVCLCALNTDDGFLSHGLRRYHCPCANLWVNTLDLSLPGLDLPVSEL